MPEDVDAYAPILADPEVGRWTGGTKTRAETETHIEKLIERWDADGVGLFTVVRNEDKRVIGRVGFLVWDTTTWISSLRAEPQGPTETEIGWTIGREFWGRGYATEAARAVRDHGLGELGLRRLISVIMVGNEASERVAEKLGMRPEFALQEPFPAPTRVWSLAA